MSKKKNSYAALPFILKPSFVKQFLLLFFLLSGIYSFAQEKATAPARPVAEKGKPSIFTDDELASSDYLASIERAGELLDDAKNKGALDASVLFLLGEVHQTKEALKLIDSNLGSQNNGNVRNQQMYRKVLLELQQKFEIYWKALNENDEKIVKIRKGNKSILKDTVFAKLIKDTLRINEFRPQLKDLKAKWITTDSLLKANIDSLNSWKKGITEKRMLISKDLILVNERLNKSGVSLFGSEHPNLWSTDQKAKTQEMQAYLKDKFNAEQKASAYYFSYSLGSTFMLLLLAGLLWWWVNFNLKSLKKAQRLENLNVFQFRYLNHSTIFPIIVIGLNIAIAINLYAPALFIEFMHLALLATLTVLFKKIWSEKAFRNWLLLVVLFALFCFLDLFVEISQLQRCLFVLVNLACIRFGFAYLQTIRDEMYIKGLLKYAKVLFISLNILAVLFNLFGRVSLAHTLSLAAIIALTQVIALSVFLKIILEIITLQIYTIRIRRGIDKIFDFKNLEKNLKKPFMLLITYLWVIVIASNLNLSSVFYDVITSIVTTENKIGNFTFTVGNILLFLLIVWIAHIIQKYVAYFFGEIDDEDEESVNKKQHSKLLITRLLLLILGYLLAISAAGIPLDKITIVLGALGVGVGLGLQNIVNNFVSGVILIFDKPIQIGDVIDVGAQTGKVKTIGLRTTKIDTSNGAEVIVPNGNILSQNIVNWTYTNNSKLVDLSFTLQGEISQEAIKKTIIDCISTIPLIYSEKEPQLFYSYISDTKHQLKIQFWCNIYRTETAISEARIALYDGFKKQGVVFE
ncbi:mechanosensitive ion channel-like protein [Flavobacterium endophyticum]|uniref:Mechanosensitive ion channel-like protein n=1 Tax=Flavobacterium endophyticum TaxID=1540163 RepID=A0A495M2Y3_9FLAO|nr:mechanosensitive ion channel domain-containing protein [Flavobacterium endophyticum]RKS20427.1 mechanosensitive ion channel-like protein [Flavobacterium endophyticum]